MNKKAVRVAIETILVILVFHLGQATSGVAGKAFVLLGLVILAYAIIDLLRKGA